MATMLTRTFLGLACLSLIVAPVDAAGKGNCCGGGGGGGGGKGGVMQKAHTLVFNHESIQRTVEELPNGVRTRNTTTDPNLVAVLQQHPKEMGDLYKNGGSVRHWDPLFVELSAVADKVTMEFRLLDDGIEVVSTSDDPEVAKLIKAHAAKVSEFVARGRDAMHEGTPLPDGYVRPDDAKKAAGGGTCCNSKGAADQSNAAQGSPDAAPHEH